MPLTIIKQPNAVCFSQNPMRFVVEPSSIWSNSVVNTSPKIRVTIPDVVDITIGKIITFKFNGITLVFTCVAIGSGTNDTYGKIFEVWNRTTSSIAYLNFMVAWMQNNWYMRLFKIVVVSDTEIDFTLTGEPCDNLVITTNVETITAYTFISGHKSSLINYKILAELWVKDGEKISEMEITPTTIAPFVSEFHFENMVDDTLKIGYPVPSNLTTIEPKTYPTKAFRIRFTEVVNGIIDISRLYFASFNAIKGGLDWKTYLQIPNFLLSEFQFLTNQPNPKTANLNTMDFLYLFWTGINNTTAIIYYTGDFPNGNTMTIQRTLILQTNCIHQIAINNEGFSGRYTVGKPLRVSVKIGVDTRYLGNTRVYEAPKINYNENQTFYFANRLGGIDSVLCSGERALKIKSNRELLNQFWDNWTVDGNIVVTRNNTTVSMRSSTTFYDRQHAVWLREFFESKQVWLKTDETTWLPVIIVTDSIALTDEKEDMVRIQFEYQYAADI